ncbi:arginase family protein [Galbibacter sp. EGI 63066]|uniref:arginase family protein n=1 Tax=Galbibacter sp. EGI 63066 TaxID=2993559 RepID=UPI002248D7F1|nr:arginase family protein [Galbibacter sp. EGI 63066]MCX2680649.1 arginase family protein [Galbibacter sp. EGI 63066]
MNSNKINILEFPSNLGLKKTESEIEPGVKKLPEWLKRHGFHKKINPYNILRIEPPEYAMDFDVESSVRNADNIIEYAINQSKMLSDKLDENTFQLIIGGDCSILIGNSIALKQKGNYGLFFLDGHTDFIWPELSGTGGAAGMDLAIVTGYGHDKLSNIFNQKPYFKEKNVFCVGNREYDQEYVRPILESEIKYFDLKTLRNNGLAKTANRFLELVRKNNLDGFFIHLDVDVLNDKIMPAVDSRGIDGLTYKEFRELLIPLLSSKKAVGIEITILDPNLDPKGKYTNEFIKNFIEIIECGKACT